jgi:hypothetical protein
MSEPRPQADFAVIRERITMERILEHYGITGFKRSGDELRGRCPLHEGKGERTLTVNTAKNVFQCFHCKAKGNVIDFVAKREGCNIREAGLKIWEWFKLDEETSSPQLAQDAPSGPSTEPAEAAHDMQAQKKVIFRCPQRCGGRIRNKVRFYLTSEPAFAVSGECDRCGEGGFVEIPLNDLFKDAPIKPTVQ